MVRRGEPVITVVSMIKEFFCHTLFFFYVVNQLTKKTISTLAIFLTLDMNKKDVNALPGGKAWVTKPNQREQETMMPESGKIRFIINVQPPRASSHDKPVAIREEQQANKGLSD